MYLLFRCGNDSTVCVADGSGLIIENLCNGKESCLINADNSVFGDPCQGTVKYVEVDYNCVGGRDFFKLCCLYHFYFYLAFDLTFKII